MVFSVWLFSCATCKTEKPDEKPDEIGQPKQHSRVAKKPKNMSIHCLGTQHSRSDRATCNHGKPDETVQSKQNSRPATKEHVNPSLWKSAFASCSVSSVPDMRNPTLRRKRISTRTDTLEAGGTTHNRTDLEGAQWARADVCQSTPCARWRESRLRLLQHTVLQSGGTCCHEAVALAFHNALSRPHKTLSTHTLPKKCSTINEMAELRDRNSATLSAISRGQWCRK